MGKKSDVGLVRAAQGGDTSAFNDLVRRHQIGVKMEAIRFLGSVDEAEDVTQEAFLRAYLKLSLLRPPYNFGGWVRQIAKNMARNLLTRGPRLVALEQQHLNDEPQSVQRRSQEDSLAQVEQAVLALSRLSPKVTVHGLKGS